MKATPVGFGTLEMPGTIRRATQLHQASAFKDAIEDRLSEVGIVQYQAPRRQRFVGGEEQGTVMQVALVDDLKHEVRSRKTISGRSTAGGRDGWCSSSRREPDGA